MNLEKYRAAHARWLEWLDGDPVHSINGQLSQLLWQDAAFRMFNEARKVTQTSEPSSAVAPILASFLDQGYVASQVLGISKLVEYSDPKRPKQGVISLRRLVDDVIANHGLLTRANFLALEGAPYDYESIRATEIQAQLEKAKDGVTVFWTGGGGEQDWALAERMHEQFDRLASVKPETRSPHDLVSEDLLARVNAALSDEVFEAIRTLRHKTLAHAATPFLDNRWTPPKAACRSMRSTAPSRFCCLCGRSCKQGSCSVRGAPGPCLYRNRTNSSSSICRSSRATRSETCSRSGRAIARRRINGLMRATGS